MSVLYDSSVIVFLCFIFFRDPSVVFNPLVTEARDYITVEFHCLLESQQWGFDNSSKVFIHFTLPEFHYYDHRYGPMQKINRLVNCSWSCLGCNNSKINYLYQMFLLKHVCIVKNHSN